MQVLLDGRSVKLALHCIDQSLTELSARELPTNSDDLEKTFFLLRDLCAARSDLRAAIECSL